MSKQKTKKFAERDRSAEAPTRTDAAEEAVEDAGMRAHASITS